MISPTTNRLASRRACSSGGARNFTACMRACRRERCPARSPIACGDSTFRASSSRKLSRASRWISRRKRYQTFAELRPYCYRVASALGLICIEIFGYRNPSAKLYAENLGLALQLTNILRDVREDAERGRIYLPLEDLARFNVSEDEILGGVYSANFVALMDFEAKRARELYAAAQIGARCGRSIDAADGRGDAPYLRRVA